MFLASALHVLPGSCLDPALNSIWDWSAAVFKLGSVDHSLLTCLTSEALFMCLCFGSLFLTFDFVSGVRLCLLFCGLSLSICISFSKEYLGLHVFSAWSVSALFFALFVFSGYCLLKLSGFPVLTRGHVLLWMIIVKLSCFKISCFAVSGKRNSLKTPSSFYKILSTVRFWVRAHISGLTD